jgi:lysophospholipase L1-like esterase
MAMTRGYMSYSFFKHYFKALFIFICFFLYSFNSSPKIKKKSLSTIHVIGDSHSNELRGIPGCKVHGCPIAGLGPITMHRVGRDGLAIINLIDLGVREGDVVVFCFGEIDARCHIGKQCTEFKRKVSEIIEKLATNYIKTILQNKILYKSLFCIVYSVTPPTDAEYNPLYPLYGTLEERIAFSKQLNAKLAELCKTFGIGFLDVYKEYSNKKGVLRKRFSDGGVHINPAYNKFISNKLYKIIELIDN